MAGFSLPLISLYLTINIVNLAVPRLLYAGHTPLATPRPRSACAFNHSQPVGSSSSDIVLLYASTASRKLMLTVKSLRSSGSRCRIILFVPESIHIDRLNRVLLQMYSVEIVRHSKTDPRSKVPHMYRYECELRWLEAQTVPVSRVLHTDAFDVFFQGDPFTSHISSTKLTLIVEPHCIRSCGWNLAWVKRCYGDSGMSALGHRFIVCSGSIGGPASEYLKLLKLMTTRPEWQTCWGESLDQPILNYLLWNGDIDRANIQYRLTGCDGGFFTMQWCVTEANVLVNEFNQVITSEGTIPSYLHQYDRNQAFARKLFNACSL
jgi:hypothetical protein